MLLKRVFDKTGLTPVLTDVLVKSATKIQKFSRRFVDQGVIDGYITLTKGQIILHTTPELTYNILSFPGIYCCFTNKALPDQISARKHIKDNFADQKSPDINNPAGYRQDNFYLCELVGESFGKVTAIDLLKEQQVRDNAISN